VCVGVGWGGGCVVKGQSLRVERKDRPTKQLSSREREREREEGAVGTMSPQLQVQWLSPCVCVCVCVERESTFFLCVN